MNKAITRIRFISTGVVRQIMVSGFGLAIPVLAVALSPKSVWGGLVPMILYTMLAIQFVNWGNKEFLLRRFSEVPSQIPVDYSINIATRSAFLVITACLGFPIFGLLPGTFVAIWLLGRFLTHSAEPLIIYEKSFPQAIAVEAAAFVFFYALLIAFRLRLDVLTLAAFYAAYQFVRGTGLFLLNSQYFSFSYAAVKYRHLKSGFLFFLLSAMGFLASKADVFLMMQFTTPTGLAEYQIINSLLVFVMSVSAFIYTPFTKNIYRNTPEVIKKSKRVLLRSGMFIVPVSLLVVRLVLDGLQIKAGPPFYLIAFAYVFPAFVYGLDVVALFREHREKMVVLFLFIAAVANFAFSGALLAAGFGLNGALAGSAAAQVLSLLMFKLYRFEK